MNNKERLELARWVVQRAKRQGADEAAVNITNTREVGVGIRDGEIENLEESTQNSLNLSIYASNRYSNHSTNDLRKQSLEKLIEEAVSMTGYLSQDPYRSLPDPKYYQGQKSKELRLRDSAFGDLSSEQRIKYTLEIEKAARSYSDKIISCTAGYGDSRSDSVKIHSNGFEGENSTTRFSAGAEAAVRGDNGERPEDWYWCTTRFLKDMPSPKILGQTAVKRALRKIGAEKLQSGKFDMILENRATGRLFWAFYYPMQAQAIQQKNSFLEGKLGEKIGSDTLTIIDDPFIESGLGSRLYDSDGLATKRRAIIEKGLLQSYYVDYYYGKKLGLEPTVGSSTNVVMDYGDRSMDDIVSATDKGILVTGFLGGNCNSTTGDFSYGITGLYIENGQVIKPVGEMNIAGSMLELWGNLAEVGNDPNIYSSWRLPAMVFKDVQFSGV